MIRKPFAPTEQQKAVIAHFGSAFISACPGAGKTQVLVERARRELGRASSGQGLAFLSFTDAAISELRSRLQSGGMLPTPPFPHYVGTFDAFLWQFFVAPFGIPGLAQSPHLIPDLDERLVAPYPRAQELPLSCFDRGTGKIIAERSRRLGFDPAAKPSTTARYETSAVDCRERFMARGELGFGDVRVLARGHLANTDLSTALSMALAARFREIVVDEAQDCNPEDIEIINWLRRAGIVTKIICDPHQSIYEFRGGVTDQLFALRDSFNQRDQLPMSGNFRSSRNISNAITAFRALRERQATDQALGPAAKDSTPVYILHYFGNSIPNSIGKAFTALIAEFKLDPMNCPVVSSTRDAACKAIGQAADAVTKDRTLQLALAVTSFHAGLEVNARRSGMEALHRIVLDLGGKIGRKTYHQCVVAEGLKPEDWRPEILELLETLRFDPARDTNAEGWLTRVREVLSPYLAADVGSIAQKLKNHRDLAAILTCRPMSSLSARTIHSVKGKEFPGVCVVLSTTTCKGILDYLTTGEPSKSAEDARKLYVAASRAERLLAIAVPRSQGARLVTLIKQTGADVTEIRLARTPL